MGMTGNLIRVSSDDFKNYTGDSSKLERLIYDQDSFGADWYLDLDKSWEAIHYLLTGKSLAETEMNDALREPIAYTIFSNQVLDEEQDFGYGPAFYNDSERVKWIAKELNNLNFEQLERHFNGNNLNNAGIYPQIWDEEEAKSFLFENLENVIRFYSSAADNEQVVIGFIN